MSKVIKEYISGDEQLRRWVDGEPVHRLFITPRFKGDEAGECCPDFSCCMPELLQPPAVRRAFAIANEKDRGAFLMTFLGTMIKGAQEKEQIKSIEVGMVTGNPDKES